MADKKTTPASGSRGRRRRAGAGTDASAQASAPAKVAAAAPIKANEGASAQMDTGAPAPTGTDAAAPADTSAPSKTDAFSSAKTERGAAAKTSRGAAAETGRGAAAKTGRGAAMKTGRGVATKTVGAAASQAGGDRTQSRSGRSGLVVALISLLLLAVVSVPGAYLIIELRSGQRHHDARLQSLVTSLERLEGVVGALDERSDLLNTRTARLNEQVAAVLKDFSGLRWQRDGSMAWRLAEVRQLVLIASRQLSLQADPETALVALQAADRRLMEMNDPALLSAREQVIADINRLRATPVPDYAGLTLLLHGLAEQAEQLPLRRVTSAPRPLIDTTTDQVAPQGGWQRFVSALREEFRDLVQVTRVTDDTVMTLPGESYFLYHNLRLQLEAARLAALLKDQAQFRASIQTASNWLGRYFDGDDARVEAALRALRQAAAVELDVVLPSLDGSLRALQAYSLERSDNTEGGGADL